MNNHSKRRKDKKIVIQEYLSDKKRYNLLDKLTNNKVKMNEFKVIMKNEE